MAIRLRRVEGYTVALCAAETDAMPGDLYLDDGRHYALAAKFARDWRGQTVDWVYEKDDHIAETQKLRDAETELGRWLLEQGEPNACREDFARALLNRAPGEPSGLEE